MPGLAFSDDDEDERNANNFMKKRNKKSLFSKFDQNEDLEERINQKEANNDDENDFSFDENDDESVDENLEKFTIEREEENPLLADFDRSSKTSLWFNKDAFDFLKDTNEIDSNLLNSIEFNEDSNDKRKKRSIKKEDSDDEDDDENEDEETKMKRAEIKKKLAQFKKEDDEEEENEKKKKLIKLTPEELALGEVMINSKKSRNQLIDDSFNK